MPADGRPQLTPADFSLLEGKLDDDPDWSVVAKKVKGYRLSTVQSQKLVGKGQAEFGGFLYGKAGAARYTMTLARQENGKWTLASFSGPDPEEI